jgi:hypothetical protein
MAEIKSALELALEKTKTLKVDKEALIKQQYVKEGMALAGKFFEEAEFSFKDSTKHYDKQQLVWVREGFLDVLMSNLVLIEDEEGLKSLKKKKEAFSFLLTNKGVLNNIFAQLEQFFSGYIEEKKKLRELIDKEYKPRLKQKEEALSKKMGQQVKLDPLSDPEYAAIIKNNVGQLKSRYQNALSQLKKQVESFVGNQE